jgi:hypothetical protein
LGFIFYPIFCHFFIRLLCLLMRFFYSFLTLFQTLFLFLWINFLIRSCDFFSRNWAHFFDQYKAIFFFDEGNEKAKITLSFLGFFECCSALFFTLRLHNFWVVFFSFLSSIFRLMVMNFHRQFWLFFCWFFTAVCCSFLKIRC